MSHVFLDSTQKIIYEQLISTKLLMEKIGYQISGKEAFCELDVMEDLGFSNNIIRMGGGFFTGMFLQWDCDRYFIPVDATVNACGVSIYELDTVFLSLDNFISSINKTKTSLKEDGIEWNFNSGNHFILLCTKQEDPSKQYLILHASDNHYKFGEVGLYPNEKTWFYNKIQTIVQGDRYIRYIVDDTAEHFYDLYLKAEKENPLRNDEVAKRIIGKKVHRILYSPHYGMPNKKSIAIGCQWNPNCVLLTSFGKNIYQIRVDVGDKLPLTPHGFGVCFKNDLHELKYKKGKLYIDDEDITSISNGFLNYKNVCNRYSDQLIDINFVRNFLKPRKVEILAEYKQLYSYNRNGFVAF